MNPCIKCGGVERDAPSGRNKTGSCKACHAARNKLQLERRNEQRRLARKEGRYEEYEAAYIAATSSRRHATKLKYKYGLTVETYNAMLARQANKCAVCQTDTFVAGRRLAVDHCHASGKVRGLLCMNCNAMLGHAKDSLETLQRAISYLQAQP